MPGNTGGIRLGASSPPHPTGILVQVADGSVRRGILRDGVTGIPGGDVGGPSYPHHIQCGGGCSGTTLCSGVERERRRAKQAQMGGMTPNRILKRGWWHGSIFRPGMATGGFKYPSRDFRPSGPADKCW